MKLKPKLDCPHCGHKAYSLWERTFLPAWGTIVCQNCKHKLKLSSLYYFVSIITLIVVTFSLAYFFKNFLSPIMPSSLIQFANLIAILIMQLLFQAFYSCFFPLEEIPTYDHSIHHDKEYYEEQRRRSNPDWYDENGNRKK